MSSSRARVQLVVHLVQSFVPCQATLGPSSRLRHELCLNHVTGTVWKCVNMCLFVSSVGDWLNGGCLPVLKVMDSLVISLSKFTSVLNPSSPKPAMAFGENDKMRMATETVFALASRCAGVFSPDVPSPTPWTGLAPGSRFKACFRV